MHNLSTQRASDWTESATGDNATATATHAAPGDGTQAHYITGVSAGYIGAAPTPATLVIKSGTTTIYTVAVRTNVDIEFVSPLKGAGGALVSAALAAGGSGIDGYVNIKGYTR